MARSDRKPVRIIDHEPLETGARHDAPVFGKRRKEETSNATSDYRPFEENGISQYFIRKVEERRERNGAREKLNRSAIRDVSPSDRFLPEDAMQSTPVPYGFLAAVAAIAFAIPLGFIYVTENLQPVGIDPIRTASIQASGGLDVHDITMTRILKNGTFVVSINGKVANRDDKTKALLPLTISLHDEDGKQIQSWRHQIPNATLKEGGTLHFMTSAIDYSGSAKTAHVTARSAR